MQRCSVSIGVGDNPRISANNYFAVTSNSLQFGANVQAYASAAGFSIQGYLGFDVLIIFSPFSFEFDFTVSFSVSFEGVNLLGLSVSGAFSGPRPWNFNGSASISILFWTVSASVNLTWGDSTPVTIPQKPVLPDLANALQTPGNWSAALPAGMTPAVTLTTPKGGSAQILVYPMGTLSVRENVTPLDVPITRYGNATPSDGTEFAISDVTINNQETQRQTLQEYFAPGQFNALSDADKLGAPSFELYDAGVTIGSSEIDAGEDFAPHRRLRGVLYRFPDELFAQHRALPHGRGDQRRARPAGRRVPVAGHSLRHVQVQRRRRARRHRHRRRRIRDRKHQRSLRALRSRARCRGDIFPGARGAGRASGVDPRGQRKSANHEPLRGGGMSPTLGRYHFEAWTRRGIISDVSTPDSGGSLDARAKLNVQVTISANNATAGTQPAAVDVQLYGPGDVIGIDPRHVVRTEPREFTTNFEPNYLCGIEFDAPDFPWLFTPAAPNGNKLRPWLVLIVLADGEFTPPSQAPNPLPVI